MDFENKALLDYYLSTGIISVEQATLLNTHDLVSNKGIPISNTNDIVKFYALEDLRINSDLFKDLNFLTNLTNLTSLNLSGGLETPLTPIEHLKNLESFTMSGIHTNDLTPLTKLPNLQDLTLSYNNKLSNITQLANLTSLKSLYIDFHNMQNIDISPIYQCNTLEVLWLNGIDLSVEARNLVNLKNLKNLKELIIYSCNLNQVDADYLASNLNLVGFYYNTDPISY